MKSTTREIQNPLENEALNEQIASYEGELNSFDNRCFLGIVRTYLDVQGITTFGIFDGSDLIGFYVLDDVWEDGCTVVHDFYIEPRWRGSGIFVEAVSNLLKSSNKPILFFVFQEHKRMFRLVKKLLERQNQFKWSHNEFIENEIPGYRFRIFRL